VHTDGISGCNVVSLFAGLALSSLVDGRHSEGVLQPLNEARAGALGGFHHRLIGFGPEQAVPLLPFDAVAGDGAAAVAAWLLPGHNDVVLVDLIDLGVSGLTGRICRRETTVTHVYIEI